MVWGGFLWDSDQLSGKEDLYWPHLSNCNRWTRLLGIERCLITAQWHTYFMLMNALQQSNVLIFMLSSLAESSVGQSSVIGTGKDQKMRGSNFKSKCTRSRTTWWSQMYSWWQGVSTCVTIEGFLDQLTLTHFTPQHILEVGSKNVGQCDHSFSPRM